MGVTIPKNRCSIRRPRCFKTNAASVDRRHASASPGDPMSFYAFIGVGRDGAGLRPRGARGLSHVSRPRFPRSHCRRLVSARCRRGRDADDERRQRVGGDRRSRSLPDAYRRSSSRRRSICNSACSTSWPGILTAIALYSVNLRIMGRPNIGLSRTSIPSTRPIDLAWVSVRSTCPSCC